MSTRILDIPFNYHASFIRPKHRNEVTQVVGDVLLMAVPDLTGYQVPVALEVKGPGGSAYDIRVFDGRLYFTLEKMADHADGLQAIIERQQPMLETNTLITRFQSKSVAYRRRIRMFGFAPVGADPVELTDLDMSVGT